MYIVLGFLMLTSCSGPQTEQGDAYCFTPFGVAKFDLAKAKKSNSSITFTDELANKTFEVPLVNCVTIRDLK
jgi:hypothetical protein